jgi:hypothetical protein
MINLKTKLYIVKYKMDKIIKQSERIDLTGADLHRITDGKCKIIQYEQLENISSLEEILEPHGCCIILYTTRANFGHWVALFRTNPNVKQNLSFFDPYGLKVDEELQIANELHLRQHNGEITPHLSALINKGGYNVKSSTYKLQKFLKDTETCGRHVGFRIRMRDIPLKKYVKLLTDNKAYDPDFWVSALTLFI